MAKDAFNKAVERAIGDSIENIRRKPIDERRREIEAKTGKTIEYKSRFPIIGRGNVLRDRVVTHKEADKKFKKAVS